MAASLSRKPEILTRGSSNFGHLRWRILGLWKLKRHW